jgi:hypothetical protein
MTGSDAGATELHTHHRFETHWNRVQIAVETLVGLVVLAGLLGLFGDGWLSRATRPLPGTPLVVHYDRFLRAGAPARLSVEIRDPVEQDTIEVGLGAALLERVSVDATQPRADEVDATPSGVTYRFHLGPEHKGSLLFTLSPREYGRVPATLTALGRTVDLSLLIYP